MKRKYISSFVVLIILLTTISAASENIAPAKLTSNPVIEVLHVSCIQQNEVQKIIDNAGASSYFNIKQVSISDFNKGTPSDLSQYDVVVFGVNDCYEYYYEKIGRNTELKNYVENGGGIFFTHDSLEHKYKYPELEVVAGVVSKGDTTSITMYSAEILQEHEILHTPFELGNIGDTIDTQKTHTTNGEVTTATIIMQGGGLSPAPNNFYLTVNKYGNGRAVVDEIGHSVAGCSGGSVNLPSVKESQIFVNALYWAGQGKSILTITTDKSNYSLGETINVNIEVNRSETYPQVVKFILELKEPYDTPDTILETNALVLPPIFYKNASVKYKIPNSPFVSGGQYKFIGTLIDPNNNNTIATDSATFNIDDTTTIADIKDIFNI